MRNVALGTVLYKLKAELRKTLDTSNTADDNMLYQLIETGQQDLADCYAWGFLKSRWDTFVPPGTRFSLFPTTLSPRGGAAGTDAAMDFNRPLEAQVKWNNIWQPVIYGIDEQEFNYLDSDRGQVLDPVQRWQMSDTTQFEVWPLPATTAQIRFVQSRSLTALQNGMTPPTFSATATLDLDDLLVVYYVALKVASYEKKANTQVLTTNFQHRLKMLLGAGPQRSETYTIGRGLPLDRKAIRLVPMVLVAGGH